MLGRKSSSSINLQADAEHAALIHEASYARTIAALNPQSTYEALDLALSVSPPKTSTIPEDTRPPSPPNLADRDNNVFALTVEEALQAAREVRPRVYEIVNYNHETVHFIFNGCSGRLGEEQKQVARKMDEVVGNRDMIGVGLGDLIYGESPATPDANCFHTYIYNVYANKNVPNLRRVKWLLGVGNHERNEDTASDVQNWVVEKVPGTRFISSFFPSTKKYLTALKTGDDAELIVRAHYYLHREGDPLIINKRKFFESKKLDYSLLPNSSMPASFYSFFVGDVQVFILNSNTYSRYFHRAFIQHVPSTPQEINQALWFEEEYMNARKAGRKIIVGWHHPVESRTPRYENGDAHHSIPDERMREEIGRYVGMTSGFNFLHTMLRKMLAKQIIVPDVIVNAHNHLLEVDYISLNEELPESTKTCVVTCGGGGGLLQPQTHFGDRDTLGMVSVNHGFVTISCPKVKPALLQIDTYTVTGNHLRFTHLSGGPLRAPDGGHVKLLRELFLAVCADYQDVLHAEKKGTFFSGKYVSNTSSSRFHHASDINALNDIVNYLNQPEPDSYKQTVNQLHHIFLRMKNQQQKESLYYALNQALVEHPAFARKLSEIHEANYEPEPRVRLLSP